MVGRFGVREADVRQLVAAVDPVVHDGPGQHVPYSVLRAVGLLVGCDHVSFQLMDPARRWVTAQLSDLGVEDPDPGGCAGEIGGDLTEMFWRGFWASAACSYPQRSGDYARVTRLSDFGGRRAMSRTMMGAYFDEVGIRHELMVPLPPAGRIDRRFLMFRSGGRDFTDRDVLLMSLLRPHLIALHTRQRHRHRGVPELTPRQRQILCLVAEGCTNAQVARALGVSEGTIRKHLENIFQRLNVTNRTAAANVVTHSAERW